MSALMRALTYLVAASVLLGGGAVLLGTLGLGNPAGDWQREQERSACLEERIHTALGRLAAKEEIAQALIEQRLTLAGAVRRMRELHDSNSPLWAALRRCQEGSSDEERVGRHLMGVARDQLKARPAKARQVALRLQGELEDLLRVRTTHAQIGP